MIKTLSSIIFIFSGLILSGALLEPSITSAVEDEVIVNLTVDSGISITSPGDVTMSNLGTAVNNSTGSAVWNVKTNDPDGYNLSVKASTSPAMRNGTNSFADYTEAVSGTPDTWSVDASAFEFGFSGFGTDVVNVNSDQYAATGITTCDNGVASSTVNATLKFLGFETSNQLISSRAATTTTSGINTTVCFAAGQNGTYAPAGLYQATITATAVAL